MPQTFHQKAMSLEEVKEMVLEPNSDISRTVTRLAEKGFIEKIINKENRRKISIIITQKGIKTLKKIEVDDKRKKITSDLSKSDAKIFVKVLTKLRQSS